MTAPLQLLSTLNPAPDLSTSAYGPFVVHSCPDLEQAARQLLMQRFDALLIDAAVIAAGSDLVHWSGLASAVLEMAVIVVTPEPAAGQLAELLRHGVQEVVPAREALAPRLALAVRQAVDRKRIEVSARRAYTTDLATGLPNRGQLIEHMTHLLALREREPASMAVLVVRVDGLANAESRLGVEAANVLRRKLAVRLRSGLRASDVVAVLGTDGFAVLLAWIDDEADGARVAAKLLQTLQRPLNVAGQDLAVAASTGVACYPAEGRDADALLRIAAGKAAAMPAAGRAGLASRVERGDAPAANDESLPGD
jgi:diguanylate cyclase (GGDEF)-like protein